MCQSFYLYQISFFRTHVDIVSQFPTAECTCLDIFTTCTDEFYSLIFYGSWRLSITQQCHTDRLTVFIFSIHTCRTVAAEPLQTNIIIRDAVYKRLKGGTPYTDTGIAFTVSIHLREVRCINRTIICSNVAAEYHIRQADVTEPLQYLIFIRQHRDVVYHYLRIFYRFIPFMDNHICTGQVHSYYATVHIRR